MHKIDQSDISFQTPFTHQAFLEFFGQSISCQIHYSLAFLTCFYFAQSVEKKDNSLDWFHQAPPSANTVHIMMYHHGIFHMHYK